MATSPEVSLLDVIEVRVLGSDVGQAVNNITHWIVGTNNVNDPIPTYNDLASDFGDWWQLAFQASQVSSYRIEAIETLEVERARIIPADSNKPEYVDVSYGRRGEQLHKAGWVGGVLGEAFPTYVAANYRKVTTVYNKHYRGSMRLGCLPEEDTLIGEGHNRWSAVAQAALQAAGDQFFLRMPSTTHPSWFLDPVIFSKTDMARNDPTGIAATSTRGIVSAELARYVSSQVSRKARFRLD